MLRQVPLRRQLRLQRVLALGRFLLAAAGAVAVATKYGQASGDGTCPVATRPALEALVAAAAVFAVAAALGVVMFEALLGFGICLFPVGQGIRPGPLHLAVRLGNLELLRSAYEATGEAASETEGLVNALSLRRSAEAESAVESQADERHSLLAGHEAALCGEAGLGRRSPREADAGVARSQRRPRGGAAAPARGP